MEITNKHDKIPKGLQVEVGSEDMIFYKSVIEGREAEIKVLEDNLKYNKFIVEHAKKELKKEEEKWKNK